MITPTCGFGPELSVLICAQNQRDDLEFLVPALHSVLKELGAAYEIIILERGARPEVDEAESCPPIRVLRLPGAKYGEALLEGFAVSSGRYVVTMDADLSHPPRFLRSFWRLRTEADMVLASRYIAGGKAQMGRIRWGLSKLFNMAYKHLADLPFEDFSSGFRMYRREILEKFRWKCRSFDLLQEILVRANADGRKIVEVPFHYKARVHWRSAARLIQFRSSNMFPTGRRFLAR